MNNPLVKKSLPHLIALLLFLGVSIIFCKPAMEGQVLSQHDTIGWKGMAQNAFEYREKNGHFPLWNPNLFSGMPNYQVAMEGKSVLPDTVKIFSFGLPKPINFFFLGCLFFYILCLSLRIKPVIGMMAGLAYSFSTYNPVLVAAGHDTQILATAFVPLLLAGLINIYEKKYWLGFALTTFGAYQQIAMNHLQVTYYLFIIALFITIGYLVKWIKEKEWKHILLSGGIAIAAAIIGLAGNALTLKTTSEYAKYTMRGGKDVQIDGDKVTEVKTSGLDTFYAFQYSLAKAESFTLLMPNSFGGGSTQRLGEKSNVVSKLKAKGVDEGNATQVAESLPRYWGALPYTAGPAYLGVLICLFGLLGFVLVKTPLRWGLLAATILGLFLSWGKNFLGFNLFVFEHVPLYNKFRAPSFAQVIPQICIGLMAALALQQLLFAEKSREWLTRDMKKILYTVGGLFALLGLLYMAMEYNSGIDGQVIQNYTDPQTGSDEMGRVVLSGMKEDRRSIFGGQILRTLGFAVLAAGAIWLYARKTISALIAAIVLLVISTLEITITSKTYLDNDMYVSPDEYTAANFTPNALEQQIQTDKDPNFRVLNMLGTSSGDPFSESRTSYFFKSVGGYHPAKLRIYQDVIEKYLSARTNPQILNMLNTRYVITQSPFTRRDTVVKRDEAYGNCWLVKSVKLIDKKVDVLIGIGQTNLRDTALVEKEAASGIVQPQPDSLSTIRMTKFDNDAIEYEADCKGPQYAVFSEIYYPKGWNAYVDEKLTPYYNTDYILRGLPLSSGKHTIRFVFEPASAKQGKSIMFIASILILISLLGGLFMAWKKGELKA